MEKNEESLLSKMKSFFLGNKHRIGSMQRLVELLEKFPQKENGKVKYLIAGSWAIEIFSGDKLDHDDIDLIVLQDPPYYIDDAVIEEESCWGVLPLDLKYFDKKGVISVKRFKGKEVYIPNFNLNICSKFIGELRKDFSNRAIHQLRCLLENLESFDKNKSKNEISYILRKLLPSTLNFDKLSEKIVDAVCWYLNGEKEEAIQEMCSIHKKINLALRFQFSKRGLDKKTKISEI